MQSTTSVPIIFGSVGSDFTLAPRFNGSVGIGQRFQFKKNPAKKRRWEIVATYSYENNGNHGFLKTQYSSHTPAVGLVRSFHVPGRFTSFAALRGGSTLYGGQDKDPRAFVSGTGGFGIHIAYTHRDVLKGRNEADVLDDRRRLSTWLVECDGELQPHIRRLQVPREFCHVTFGPDER